MMAAAQFSTPFTSTPRGGRQIADDASEAVEKALFRSARTCYPGAGFTGKSRYDLPRRFKTYREPVEDAEYGFPQQHNQLALTTPRTGGMLGDLGRTMLMQASPAAPSRLEAKVLPERPLLMPGQEDVYGVLVLGGKAAAKTSLVVSLMTAMNQSYPSKKKDPALCEKIQQMPQSGQTYEIGKRDIRLPDNSTKPMRFTLIDTPAAGSNGQDELPLCNTVSPNSLHHFSSLPSWMRMMMRSGITPVYSVLLVIDATAPPLWEDHERCRQLARLLAVLKRSDFNVIIAITKLLRARSFDKEPRNCYETYASRYIEKVTTAIQAKAAEAGWSFSAPSPEGITAQSFPLSNVTIFDAPTWQSTLDYRKWQETTPLSVGGMVPNGRYYQTQLNKILTALSAFFCSP